MAYRLELLPRAAKQLADLSADLRRRVSTRIGALAEDPRPSGIQKLRGRDQYRLRIGDYRVLYVIDDDARIVTIATVGHRRDVYR